VLTPNTLHDILQPAGELEASSAGEQLAKDSRSGCDGHPSDGLAARQGEGRLPNSRWTRTPADCSSA